MCVVLFADDYRLDEVLSDFLKQWWDKVHLNAELWSTKFYRREISLLWIFSLH